MPIEGLDRLKDALRERAEKAAQEAVRVVVGYSAPYAMVIHEDLERRHPNGSAKYLEQPAREMGKDIGRTIGEAVKAGTPLPDAMLQGGQMLLTASQQLVPVQTGFLRDSGYVRVEQGE